MWKLNFWVPLQEPKWHPPSIHRFTYPPRGGHKPGKHGKPGKLREFEKWSKSQGKLREFEKWSKSQGKLREILIFAGKAWKPGKMKNSWHDHQQKCIPLNFPLLSFSGKNLKIPWKSQGNSGNLVSQKCGHPVAVSIWWSHCSFQVLSVPKATLSNKEQNSPNWNQALNRTAIDSEHHKAS